MCSLNGKTERPKDATKQTERTSGNTSTPSVCSPSHSNLDISTFYGVFDFNYSQHRRFIKSINRLNYLQYINFDFGRSTAITLTISNDYISDKVAISNAINRFERYLRCRGIFHYVVAKELGALNDRLHYHFIIFNCPFLDMKAIDKVWRIGSDIKFQEIKNPRGAIYYITAYIKKGVNLQFSRRFFTERLLSNDVYYTVQYNKKTGALAPHAVYGAYISKSDYNIFSGRIPSPVFDVYATAWRYFCTTVDVHSYKYLEKREAMLSVWRWSFQFLNKRLL